MKKNDKSHDKIHTTDTTATTTTTRKIKAIIWPPSPGFQNSRRSPPSTNFAIRKDGSYVYIDTAYDSTDPDMKYLVYQTAPNGLPLSSSSSSSSKQPLSSRLTKNNISGYRDGPSSIAHFFSPLDVAILPDGMSVAVVDPGNEAVRLIAWPGGEVSTMAGVGVTKPEIGDEVRAKYDGKYYRAKVIGQSENGYYSLVFKGGARGDDFNLVQNGLHPVKKKGDGSRRRKRSSSSSSRKNNQNDETETDDDDDDDTTNNTNDTKKTQYASDSDDSHASPFATPQKIATRSDGGIFVSNGTRVYSISPDGDAIAPLPFETAPQSPIAILPDDNLVFVGGSSWNEGALVEYSTRTRKATPIVPADGDYYDAAGDGLRITSIAVDVWGRMAVLDVQHLTYEELIDAGASKDYASAYSSPGPGCGIIYIINREERTVKRLDLISSSGAAGDDVSESCHRRVIRPNNGTERIDMGDTLPGGTIRIDGYGNIVLFSEEGFQVISNTGLGPGLTAYNSGEMMVANRQQKGNDEKELLLKMALQEQQQQKQQQQVAKNKKMKKQIDVLKNDAISLMARIALLEKKCNNDDNNITNDGSTSGGCSDSVNSTPSKIKRTKRSRR